MTSQRSVTVCRKKRLQAPSEETDLTPGDGAQSDRTYSGEGGRGEWRDAEKSDEVELGQADVSGDE